MDELESSSTEQLDAPPTQIPARDVHPLVLFIQRIPPGWFVAVSLIVIFIFFQFVGGLISLLIFGARPSAQNVMMFRVITMGGQFLLLLVPTLILAKLRFPQSKNFFRVRRISVQQIILVLFAVLALQQLLQGYMMLQDSIPVHFPPQLQELIDQIKEMMEDMYTMLTVAHSIPELIFVVIVIAATPAICEEFLFRGLIQRTLEQRTAPDQDTGQRHRGRTAAIIAGVVFALYHLNPFSFVPLATLGIYFGWIVYRTQNILTSIVAHFFNNFLASIAAYYNLKDDFIALSPRTASSPAILIANFVICTLVFLAATYYLVKRVERINETLSEPGL